MTDITDPDVIDPDTGATLSVPAAKFRVHDEGSALRELEAEVARLREAVRDVVSEHKHGWHPDGLTAALNRLSAVLDDQQPEVFVSASELANAIRNPRYKRDPEYREEVRTKLARSNVFGRRPQGDQP